MQNFFGDNESEFKAFAEALKAPLPSTFRITGMRDTAVVFRDMIEKRYIADLKGIEVDGKVYEGPVPVAFYPNRLGWTFDISRHCIRKHPKLKRFKELLVAMNEKGNLSRQEAVSMIPPLVLDVEPHHKVLDMCAAPGSKTAQIIEMLHSDSNVQPTGLVIANDSENKRCYILTRQTKRLQSPNFVVTNLDASRFPTIKIPSTTTPGETEPLRFDRILCDVPCSGDGTLRKNPKVWQNWNQMAAVGLHKLQTRIAYRGAQLLEIGGRLVYSTCSFNPIENEAVVANLLRSCKGALELVDVSDKLPELIRSPGLSTWTVAEKFGKVLPSYKDIDPKLKKQFMASMWPPSSEEAGWMHLNRSMRVFPHQQNTGGFFIAVFTKTDNLPPREGHGPMPKVKDAANDKEASLSTKDKNDGEKDETAKSSALAPEVAKPDIAEKTETDDPAEITANAPASFEIKSAQKGYREDPFYFNNPKSDKSYWPPVKEFYGFDDSFPAENLVTRTEGSKKRHIYFVSDLVRSILMNNPTDTLRIINCGVKVLTRSDAKNAPCDFRVCMDGLYSTFPFLTRSGKRVASCSLDDLTLAIREEGAKFDQLSKALQEQLANISVGCMVLSYEGSTNKASPEMCPLQVTIWRADAHVRTLVSKDDRMFYDILLDNTPKADTVNETAMKRANDEPTSAESTKRAKIETFVSSSTAPAE